MKKSKQTLWLIPIISIIVVLLIGCSTTDSKQATLIIPDDPAIIQDGDEIPPNAMIRLAWNDSEGLPLLCDVVIKKGDEIIQEYQGVKEIETNFSDEGHYSATITPIHSRKSKTIQFTVAEFYNQLYNSDKGLYYIEEASEDFKNGLGVSGDQAVTFFTKMTKKTVENEHPEETNVEVYLIPIDQNDDGIIDAWGETEEQAEAVPYIGGLKQTPSGKAVFNRLLYTEDEILVLDLELIEGEQAGQIIQPDHPITLASVGFDLNTEYARMTINKEKPKEYHFRHIMLAERYNSDEKPVFSIELEEVPDDLNKMRVKINAPNVAEYAELYKTQYMQLAVTFPSGLALNNVEFPNFFEDHGEVSGHQVMEIPSADQSVAMLFKGITGDQAESGQVSDTFAILHLEMIAEQGSGKIGLTYSSEEELAASKNAGIIGPLFKDTNNRNVDGFIVDYESAYTFSWIKRGEQE